MYRHEFRLIMAQFKEGLPDSNGGDTEKKSGPRISNKGSGGTHEILTPENRRVWATKYFTILKAVLKYPPEPLVYKKELFEKYNHVEKGVDLLDFGGVADYDPAILREQSTVSKMLSARQLEELNNLEASLRDNPSDENLRTLRSRVRGEVAHALIQAAIGKSLTSAIGDGSTIQDLPQIKRSCVSDDQYNGVDIVVALGDGKAEHGNLFTYDATSASSGGISLVALETLKDKVFSERFEYIRNCISKYNGKFQSDGERIAITSGVTDKVVRRIVRMANIAHEQKMLSVSGVSVHRLHPYEKRDDPAIGAPALSVEYPPVRHGKAEPQFGVPSFIVTAEQKKIEAIERDVLSSNDGFVPKTIDGVIDEDLFMHASAYYQTQIQAEFFAQVARVLNKDARYKTPEGVDMSERYTRAASKYEQSLSADLIRGINKIPPAVLQGVVQLVKSLEIVLTQLPELDPSGQLVNKYREMLVQRDNKRERNSSDYVLLGGKQDEELMYGLFKPKPEKSQTFSPEFTQLIKSLQGVITTGGPQTIARIRSVLQYHSRESKGRINAEILTRVLEKFTLVKNEGDGIVEREGSNKIDDQDKRGDHAQTLPAKMTTRRAREHHDAEYQHIDESSPQAQVRPTSGAPVQPAAAPHHTPSSTDPIKRSGSARPATDQTVRNTGSQPRTVDISRESHPPSAPVQAAVIPEVRTQSRASEAPTFTYTGGEAKNIAGIVVAKVITQNGKEGLVDVQGKILIPCGYDGVFQVNPTRDPSGNPVAYKVKINGKLGIVSVDGRVLIPCEYDYLFQDDPTRDPSGNPIAYQVIKDGKQERRYVEGYAPPVTKTDPNPRPASNPQAPESPGFTYTGREAKNEAGIVVAKVITQNGKEGLVDLQGKILIPCEYQMVWTASPERDNQGNAIAYQVDNGQKIGYRYVEGYVPPVAKTDPTPRPTSNPSTPKASTFTYTGAEAKNKEGIVVAKVITQFGKEGLVDSHGKIIVPAVYEKVNLDYSSMGSLDSSSAYEVTKDGKRGIVGIDGTVLVPCEFDGVSILSPTRDPAGNPIAYAVTKNSKYGIVGVGGTVVIPCEYQYVSPGNPTRDSVGNPIAYQVMKDGKQERRYIDGYVPPVTKTEPKPRPTLNPRTPEAPTFTYTGEVSKDKDGKVIARVYEKDNKQGLVDLQDKVLIPFEYDGVRTRWPITDPSGNPIAYLVFKNRKWGAFGKDGKVLVPCEYESIIDRDYTEDPSGNPIAFAVKKNGKWGIVGTDGKILIPFEYESTRVHDPIRDPSCNPIAYQVTKDGKKERRYVEGYVPPTTKTDPNPRPASNPQAPESPGFTYTGREAKNEAGIVIAKVVSQNGKQGLVDLQGEIIIPCMYDYVLQDHPTRGPSGNSVAYKVYNNRKIGIVGIDGTVLVPCEYDGVLADESARDSSGRPVAYSVRKNGKYGVVGINGNVLIPCNFMDVDLYAPKRDVYGNPIAYAVYDGKNSEYRFVEGYTPTVTYSRLNKNPTSNPRAPAPPASQGKGITSRENDKAGPGKIAGVATDSSLAHAANKSSKKEATGLDGIVRFVQGLFGANKGVAQETKKINLGLPSGYTCQCDEDCGSGNCVTSLDGLNKTCQ